LEISSPSSSSAFPIPSRNRKTSTSSDEGDDQNFMLGRTLPSSPPITPLPAATFLDESIDNRSLSPSNQNNSPRLGEIAEEDEGTMSSPSTNLSGQPQNNGHESSSSSASTSDNDDDIMIGLLIPGASKQTENSRVKGKGVARIIENERENVS